MTLTALKNKKILIIGAGRDGQATLLFLRQNLPGQTIDIVDQTQGPNYLSAQRDYEIVVKSPGVRPDVLSVPYTTPANIFFANVRGMTIGITGSKGKSTTASLVTAILQSSGRKAHLVGNIGIPMLSQLQITNTNSDIWICELSSFMTVDLNYSPHISVILNLFPEHMDYHGSISSYYEAKLHIVAHAGENDFFIYTPAFNLLSKLAKETKAQSIPLTKKLPFPKEDILLLGEHNFDNVRAAVTVAQMLHIDPQVIHDTVKKFRPLRHRLENIGTFNGIIFYDDAISTAPQSTMQAIKTLKNIGTLFLGGQDRGYDFTDLVDMIKSYEIPNIVLFPNSGEAILQVLKKRCKKLPNIFQTSSMDDAINFAYKYTRKGTICLLSTASPSYTLWKNFEEKGDEFRKKAKELAPRV